MNWGIENKEIEKYFYILSKEIPDFLIEYANVKEMQRLKGISMVSACEHTKLIPYNFFHTRYEHSFGVALIVWNFTKDKKQTIAGLYHDIATPSFSHVVDYLHGDYEKQETTESLTERIIKNSEDIMELLKRDNIKVEEIEDYHIYPIADNDTPKLSSDRLEYSLSNALFTYNLLNKEEIKEIYNDIEIGTNEKHEKELSFKTKKIARNFVKITSKLSVIYREDRTRYSMQFLADILKRLNNEKTVSIDDLYKLKESEIIDIIEKSKYKEVFDIWKNAKKVKISKEEPNKVYFVHHGAKVRYIDPLFNGVRMSKACKIAKNMIDKNLNYDMNSYIYLDFELK